MLTVSGTGTTGTRLDWNESPFGPSPVAIQRVRANAGDLHRYPRGLLGTVTAAVAHAQGLDPAAVLLTNGVDEAIDLVLGTVDSAWFVSPGFDGYSDRARVLGRPTRVIPLDARWNPAIGPEEPARGGAVFLAQPHNPTGTLFPADWVAAVVDRAELTFLDVTYRDFAVRPAPLPSPSSHPNLLRFESFSKIHGLAGIRLGS